jgi:hypothetical protein
MRVTPLTLKMSTEEKLKALAPLRSVRPSKEADVRRNPRQRLWLTKGRSRWWFPLLWWRRRMMLMLEMLEVMIA